MTNVEPSVPDLQFASATLVCAERLMRFIRDLDLIGPGRATPNLAQVRRTALAASVRRDPEGSLTAG
jgi:hypothetical protein